MWSASITANDKPKARAACGPLRQSSSKTLASGANTLFGLCIEQIDAACIDVDAH